MTTISNWLLLTLKVGVAESETSFGLIRFKGLAFIVGFSSSLTPEYIAFAAALGFPQPPALRPLTQIPPKENQSCQPASPTMEADADPVLYACAPCKKNKRRCDKRIPSCGSCLKLAILCLVISPSRRTANDT
jgi:hypothetical protein